MNRLFTAAWLILAAVVAVAVVPFPIGFNQVSGGVGEAAPDNLMLDYTGEPSSKWVAWDDNTSTETAFLIEMSTNQVDWIPVQTNAADDVTSAKLWLEWFGAYTNDWVRVTAILPGSSLVSTSMPAVYLPFYSP